MIDPNTYALMFKRDPDRHFVATKKDRRLLSYEGGIYVPDGDTIIHSEIMRMTMGEGVSTHRMNEIVNLIKWDNYVEHDDFDANPNVINMDNGLYHIETGISPHTPKYLSLHKSPIAYDPEAECPAIDKFIREVVPEEYVQTIYEMGGYAMSPHKNLKKAFIFVGEPNSGKSVLIALFKYLVGSKATTDVSPLTVSNTTFGSAQYHDKMLNLVDDLGNTPIRDTGILKSVIGGGSIEGQYKHGQPFDYTPNVLCIFATNDIPKIEPFDEAYASRFSIIEFPNLFEGEFADPNLKAKLSTPEELSGFFNKCMDALADLKEREAFTEEKTIADSVKAYQYQSNPIERFLDEVCDFDDPDAYVLVSTLYTAYVKWSQEKHIRKEDKKDLTISLGRRGCINKRVTTDEEERKAAYHSVNFKHRVSDFA